MMKEPIRIINSLIKLIQRYEKETEPAQKKLFIKKNFNKVINKEKMTEQLYNRSSQASTAQPHLQYGYQSYVYPPQHPFTSNWAGTTYMVQGAQGAAQEIIGTGHLVGGSSPDSHSVANTSASTSNGTPPPTGQLGASGENGATEQEQFASYQQHATQMSHFLHTPLAYQQHAVQVIFLTFSFF